MSDVVRSIQRSDEVMRRQELAARRAAARARRGAGRLFRRLRRAFYTAAGLSLALLVYGLIVGGIGIGNFILAAIVIPMIALAVLIWPSRKVDAADLPKVAAEQPARLARQVDEWLTQRRAALPLAADPLVGGISQRLDTLQGQLKLVDARDPLAQDVGRLLGQHLPGLVDNYEKLPVRSEATDRQLVEGLRHVEAELGRVSDELASGQRDAFLTQGRFIEMKYGKDGGATS